MCMYMLALIKQLFSKKVKLKLSTPIPLIYDETQLTPRGMLNLLTSLKSYKNKI